MFGCPAQRGQALGGRDVADENLHGHTLGEISLAGLRRADEGTYARSGSGGDRGFGPKLDKVGRSCAFASYPTACCPRDASGCQTEREGSVLAAFANAFRTPDLRK